jgi:hypothetical protein
MTTRITKPQQLDLVAAGKRWAEASAVVIAICVALSSCATNSPRAWIKGQADIRRPFDRSMVIAVSPQNENSIVDRNLAYLTEELLREQGYIIGQEYDYILKVSATSKDVNVTKMRNVSSSSRSTVNVGDKQGTVNTYTSINVPVQEKMHTSAISFVLWDARDMFVKENGVIVDVRKDGDVVKVWIGGIAARATTIDGRETEALRKLIEHIGTTGTFEVSLTQ